MNKSSARMAKLVNAADLKSAALMSLRVRFPFRAFGVGCDRHKERQNIKQIVRLLPRKRERAQRKKRRTQH